MVLDTAHRGKQVSAAAVEPKAARVSRDSSRRTREMILDGALAFSEKGFDGARIDEIALRAGVNKNLLYHHYGSKDCLFAALLERTYETIRLRQNDLQLRGMAPVEAMRKLRARTSTADVACAPL